MDLTRVIMIPMVGGPEDGRTCIYEIGSNGKLVCFTNTHEHHYQHQSRRYIYIERKIRTDRRKHGE